MSTFVVFLNETILGVAMPHLMADLAVAAVAAQWLTTAFLLTMAIVIPVTGFLLQRLHTRQVFLSAMTLFCLGTLIGSLAQSFEVLLIARIVQAAGTAVMMPLLMTTVLNLVPIEKRGRTMGYIAIVMSVSPAIGPTISGLVLSILPWRFLFIVVLPVAFSALALGAAKLPNVTTPKRIRIDVTSVLLSAVAFGGLVFGLSGLGGHSSSGTPALASIAAGIVFLGIFIARQVVLQGSDEALLDLRAFRSGTFAIAVAMIAMIMMVLFGTLILLPIFMQTVLGLSTLSSGLLLLPGGLAMGLLGSVSGRLFDRFGPRPLLVPGTVILGGALWALSSVSEVTSWRLLLAMHIAFSIGLAVILTPLFSAGLGSLSRSQYSHGSAVLGTIQQIAGAAGTALFIAVMTGVTDAQTSASAGATAAGARAAFACGAIIVLPAIVGAFFVRKPK
ncbi:DHA2 family efflux MFS transporter permease subunit [Pseudarthrobacter sp. R1]|uniref:DHA2 family efflux MFS transporter permease subunit n=1 Tax=Pseudarthrobacter sp. R1 TaxID=2944934 RepID=UPI00210C2FC8|nr:DHA2 family efflux MFS transporter permease subunit [Pseudarthrobacter sp. R1]MCQ6272320.1 DHA2 family efflux MFS transporter permease subunit [Pseudarthrobacter sp. R1]